MTAEEPRKVKRKRPSSLPSILSMAMVLFLLGLLGMLIIDAKKISEYLRENIQVDIYFKEEATEKDALSLKMELDKEPFTKAVTYVSKEEAAARMKDQLGQDFENVLGYNPLPYSLELFVKAGHSNKANLEALKARLMQNPMVDEVTYQDFVYDQLDKNVFKIGLALGCLSVLFLIISVILINSAIRLSIYARRFLIKSMQLVGATEWFIIRPFVWRAVLQSIYGFIIAVGLMVATVIGILRWFPEYKVMLMVDDASHSAKIDNVLFGLLLAALLVLGLLISLVSSFISTKKYLRTKIDDLY